MIVEQCERNCFCKDCTDEKCIYAGDKMADCPKWVCDENRDCDNCTFLKGFYAEMKKGGAE